MKIDQKALSYIGIKIADTLKSIPTPVEKVENQQENTGATNSRRTTIYAKQHLSINKFMAKI